MASSSTTTITTTSHPASNQSLPPELIDALNQTYLLHILAVDQNAVLPPGKSLLAMLARTGNIDKQGQTDLHRTVEGIIHKAFWDEAIEFLSSPFPSAQLARLKLLYSDLAATLSPLLPPKHRVIVSLFSPIPPTSAPLQSCILFLKEILLALKERCAPARDDEVLQIIDRLDEYLPAPSPISPTKPSLEGTSPNWSPLAERIVETIRSIITLSEHMKSDLEQFALGTLSESQLRVVINQQAKVRERELVLNLWKSGTEGGEDVLRRIWARWVAEPLHPQYRDLLHSDVESRDGTWVPHLVQVLGSTIPISCNVPGPASTSSTTIFPVSSSQLTSITAQANDLPPQFLISSPTLFYLQNLLQALVIAAVLRSLTRLPPSTGSTSLGGGFMQRIWSLLKAEIDEPDLGSDSTKAVNLEDEVIRARTLVAANQTNIAHGTDPSAAIQSSPPLDKDEESRLRAAVQRTLRPQDPVFILLQKRLLVSMAQHLLHLVTLSSNDRALDGTGDSISAGSSGRTALPSRMQTGRELSAGDARRTQIIMEDAQAPPQPARAEVGKVGPIQGFEDPVLSKAVEEAFEKLARCVEWVRDTWSDTIQLPVVLSAR